jgi:hypothetical protein
MLSVTEPQSPQRFTQGSQSLFFLDFYQALLPTFENCTQSRKAAKFSKFKSLK